MVVLLVIAARDISVTFGVPGGFAFIALVVDTAHERVCLTVPSVGVESRRRRRLVEGDYAVTSSGARRFIYEFNGQPKLNLVEEDQSGGMEMPSIGSIINRHDKDWKVTHLVAPVSSNGTIPVVRVFLSDIGRLKGGTFASKRAVP
jgi:hypothetical protein